MKQSNIIITFIICALCIACNQRQVPKYPATAEGITQMRIDSAAYYLSRHNTRRAMIQLKAAEKHLPNVRTDSIKFNTYLKIAHLNAQNGAYKVATDYYKKAEKHTNDTKRNHHLADIYLGRAFVYAQTKQWKLATQTITKAEKLRPRIRKDQEKQIAELKERIGKRQMIAVSSDKDAEIVHIQDRYETTLAQRNMLEQRLYFSYAIIGLLLLAAGIIAWFKRYIRKQEAHYNQQLMEIEANICQTLNEKNTTIDEMKRAIDERIAEIEKLKNRNITKPNNTKSIDSIENIKIGIDALCILKKGENISQMGRKEQQAIMAVMYNLDYEFACFLNNPRFALTPKETFFCVMEREGRNDDEKAEMFCCSNQAIRSIKSRLNKKGINTFSTIDDKI